MLLVGGSAAAHVLPADYILRMMVERHRRLGIADLTIELTTEVGRNPAGVEERIYIKNPERMRRVRPEGSGALVTVQVEGEVATGPEGALKRGKAPLDLLLTLLHPTGEELEDAQRRLLAVLKREGIDSSVVTLGRQKGTIAYVIGGKAQDLQVPQLWIEKETFLPLKLVLPRKVDGKLERLEVRWLEFGSSTTGEWFPRVLEIWRDGQRLERSEVTKVQVNKKVPETLFALP